MFSWPHRDTRTNQVSLGRMQATRDDQYSSVVAELGCTTLAGTANVALQSIDQLLDLFRVTRAGDNAVGPVSAVFHYALACYRVRNQDAAAAVCAAVLRPTLPDTVKIGTGGGATQ